MQRSTSGMSGLFHCLEVERCKDSGLMSAVAFCWMLRESQGGVVQPWAIMAMVYSKHVGARSFSLDAAGLCSVAEYHVYSKFQW